MTNFEPCAAEVMRRFARASGGEMIEVGGGVAGFVESDSPVNAVKGMDGAVGRAELNRIVEFYSDHKKDAVVELAPWVEAACLGDLVALGFERVAVEDLMARRSEDLGEKFDAVMDVEACARVLCLSFFGEINETGMAIGRMAFGGEGMVSVGHWEDGDLVSVGQMIYLAGAGLLAGDGTVEAWRGRGLQQRMIRARVQRAFDDGVEWVHCEVAQGSGSQRNYARCGFSTVYARVHYLKRFQ
jgi:hypothetical protein